MSEPMTDSAREVLEAARALSPEEQVAVLTALERSIAQAPSSLHQKLERLSSRFWRRPSIEELAREQHIEPVTDLDTLQSGAWPEDESLDDFLSFLYQERRGQ